MSEFNNVTLSGKIVKDAKTIKTDSGFFITEVFIVVNKNIKKGDKWESVASFFPIKLFGEKWQKLSLKSGGHITINGYLSQSSWKDKNGDPVSKVEIVADKLFVTAEQKKDVEVDF